MMTDVTLIESLKSRNAAIAVFAAVTVLILLLIIVPLASLFAAQQDEIESSLHRLAVYKAQVETRSALTAQSETLKKQVKNLSGLFAADTSALAQAQVQRAVADIVKAEKGEVRTARMLLPLKEGSFETIAIQYSITIPMYRLAGFLHALETRTPYLFLDEVAITAPANWKPENPEAAHPSLDIRCLIRGYRWADIQP